MAVKKTTKKKDESAAPAKAEAKEPAPKKTTKKAAPKAAAAPAVIETPATPPPVPAPEPTPEPKAKTAPKKAAAKKAAAPVVKLSASQDELLKKIGSAAETGYVLEKKAEQRSIDSLLEKKLIKKGAKDKTSGALHYHISSAGKKHLS